MKLHLYYIAILCLFFSFGQQTVAQEQFGSRYNVSFVTMENGLLHNFIDDIYKDSRGFLWISTNGGGLSRYDGYEFIHYHINTPGAKLKSNFISACQEDDFGRLWIISQEGIDILNLDNRKMTAPRDPLGLLPFIAHRPALNILKDSGGNIWIYGAGTLNRVSFDADGSISAIHKLEDIPARVNEIAMLDPDEDGNIWAGIGNKVYKVQPTNGDKLEATLLAPVLEFVPDVLIRVFCMKENELWIGTETGLIRYNKSENIIKRYGFEARNPRSLTQNHISDLAITSEKQLLISTLRGLNIYNPVTDDFEQIMQNPKNPGNNLNSNFVNCLLIDRDIIWIATETGGLNKMTPRILSVKNYFHSEDDPQSISPNPVNAIYEDNSGNLWVGTVEGGLNKKEPGKDSFTHYTEQSAGLSHNSVSALTADKLNQLWVGTWGHGITIYDMNGSLKSPKKRLLPWLNPDFPISFVGSLCYDYLNNLMWIGTNWGIYYYDLETDKLHSPFENESIANRIHSSLGAVIDQHGQLWMGCTDGLFVFDLKSRKDHKFKYSHLKNKLDDPTSGLTEKIASIHLSSDSVLWVGSNGCGLYKYIPGDRGNSGKFKCYTTEQGLINNVVRGILEDDKKRLWISTNNGLSCFDPETETFINYTQDNDLGVNQFYWNAFCSTQDGTLYFGTINGLTAINPDVRNIRIIPNNVTLTKASVMNEEIYPGSQYIDTDISTVKTLTLHENDKSFSLEFSALNYESSAAAVYSYRLEGFDNHWIEVPASRRFANYTNLPAGKYTFQVKYSPDGTPMDDPVTELRIIVSPFFYKTPWFITLMVLLAICIFCYFYLQRINTLQKQKELLHQKVEERTQELKAQKQLLEDQTKELSRQNETLTHQNEKITNQKTQLIRMSKKVQELTMDKISFFTGITHEFRTPITLIIGPIERALKLSYNPQVIEQLNFVERNSKYLLSLVNQLMDFRKVESGKMEIVKTKSNFMKFITSIICPFEVFASERKITIRKYFRLDSPDFLFDPDAMQKVITNLVSNAIKFTPDGGTVSIYIASIHDKDSKNEKLYLSVKDTGTGINEEDLPKIFNRFYQSRNHVKFPVYGQSGTGIGLYLCKQIVHLHGGTIKAINNRKGGSNFRILLPLLRKDGETTHNVPESPIIINEEKQHVPAHFVPGHLTLLVVDDNADMRSFIRSILIEQYNILEAENGEQALSVLSQNNIDMIISDLMMPVMDGIELSRRVRENFTISHIPFLMLTAKTSQEARIESYRKGVDAYLMKPFTEELLLTRISNMLESRKRYQHSFSNNMDVAVLEMEEESNDKKFLDKALEIIKENYKNSYYESNDFIEAMGVSKSLLNKKLQTLTGQSIGQFIRNYRLNLAREMIEKNKVTKNMNISEIAYEVGFNDPKYFTRCFSKRFNVPPSSLMGDEL